MELWESWKHLFPANTPIVSTLRVADDQDIEVVLVHRPPLVHGLRPSREQIRIFNSRVVPPDWPRSWLPGTPRYDSPQPYIIVALWILVEASPVNGRHGSNSSQNNTKMHAARKSQIGNVRMGYWKLGFLSSGILVYYLWGPLIIKNPSSPHPQSPYY